MGADKSNILSVRNVCQRKKGVQTLDFCSMEVFHEEIYGVLVVEGHGVKDLIDLLLHNTEIEYGRVEYCHKLVNSGSLTVRPAENRIYLVSSVSCLIAHQTIAENFSIGSFPGNSFLYRPRRIRRILEEYFKQYGIDISPEKRVSELTPFEQLEIELIKAAASGYSLIILDNSVLRLGEKDLQKLHSFMRTLTQYGSTFLYFCQHHETLKKVCDRIAIFGQGKIRHVYEDYSEITRDARVFGQSIYKYNEDIKPSVCSGRPVEMFRWLGTPVLAAEGDIIFVYDDKPDILREIGLSLKKDDPESRIFIDFSHFEDFLDQDDTYLNNLCFYIGEKKKGFWANRRNRESIRLELKEELGPCINDLTLYNTPRKDKLNILYYGAMLASPSILICKYPLYGLDIPLRYHVLTLLMKCKKQGITVVMLSSELYDLLFVSDRLVISRHGKVRQYDRNHYDQVLDLFPDSIPDFT